MKVMYIASNPPEQENLRLEQDITELQRTATQTSGARVDFNFLPALPFEDIEQHISIFRPDILHISAHGTEQELMLSNSKDRKVPLTAETLRSLIASHPPKLLLISACTSHSIAEQIVGTVPFAIGVTAPITNFAARKSAITLYRMILRGETLSRAYEAADATLKALSDASAAAHLAKADGMLPEKTVLYRLPKIVAHFVNHRFPTTVHEFSFNIGLSGASPDTMQIAFMTDDETFVHDDETDHANELCSIVRSSAVKGEIWLEDPWTGLYGDFRLFALATTADGNCYPARAMLCEAIRTFYDTYYDTSDDLKYPEALKSALSLLELNDGALMRPKASGRIEKAREKTKLIMKIKRGQRKRAKGKE